MKILILGLSITSSWGNGHATTYRALCSALKQRGHAITFMEKDVEWYRSHRDLPNPSCCSVRLYDAWSSEREWLLREASEVDLVVVGSYFSDAIAAIDLLAEHGKTPILFYDIDTPITIAKLRKDRRTEYLRADQIPLFEAYLSFSGGPVLDELTRGFGAQVALPFYCSVDSLVYKPVVPAEQFTCDLSYLGTYASDRQQKLMDLLDGAATHLQDRSFIVAGSQYPDVLFSRNVRRIEHLPPSDHPAFYSSTRFTLNLTRAEMVEAGYSPSVRLFEAAACGSPIISDRWKGMEDFFEPGEQILLADTAEDVVGMLTGLSDVERSHMAESARQRVLEMHSSDHRALEFEEAAETIFSRSKATAVR